MPREFVQCRRCRQIVRYNWPQCPHCGVSAPGPRSARRALRSAGVLVLLIVGWWIAADTPTVDRLVGVAKRFVKSVRTLDNGPSGWHAWGGGISAAPRADTDLAERTSAGSTAART